MNKKVVKEWLLWILKNCAGKKNHHYNEVLILATQQANTLWSML